MGAKSMPEGVSVRIPAPLRSGGGRIPRVLLVGLALAALFYAAAHLSIIRSVWPVHGAAPGSDAILMRDGIALLAWLLVPVALRMLRFRGSWMVVVLPVTIFLLSRPGIFHVFTDPVYQAASSTRAEANDLKAERSQLTTILRAYDQERQELVLEGDLELPSPLLPSAADRERGWITRVGSAVSVFVAPLALLIGFLLARRPRVLRLFREHRRIPFAVTLGIFFVLTLFFTRLGKVGGTTPWELFLPIFIGTWAAVLADDSYNLARPGEVLKPRRMLGLLLYGALPLVPFLLIRELGLSVVFAGSLATMLLVGTRRGWWAALMGLVWIGLIFAAFQLDLRSATRLRLAYDLYPELSEFTPEAAEAWAAKVHQMKLFDANVLEGELWGEGPGRGHPETAPNAADDGYITLVAAQWGWLGAVSLVLLYSLFLLAIIGVGMRERSAFERTLVIGLAMLIGIPFWLATLGGIRVVPLTGVAAAFTANGGAKLLASALAVGVVAGISHRRAVETVREEAAPLGEGRGTGVQVR